MNPIPNHSSARRCALALLWFAAAAGAQTPPAADESLTQLAWLDGCWRGEVNQREFREHWMPLRGGLLLGMSHTVMAGKSLGYEFLRIEARPDGVFYVAAPSGAKEDVYKFSGKTLDATADRNMEIYTFENPALEFPRRIIYRRGSGGWLYAHVEGVVKGADRQVIYPMRRIDCATGAFIEK